MYIYTLVCYLPEDMMAPFLNIWKNYTLTSKELENIYFAVRNVDIGFLLSLNIFRRESIQKYKEI